MGASASMVSGDTWTLLDAEYSGGAQEPVELRSRLLSQVKQHLALPSPEHEEHLVDMFLGYMTTLATHERTHGSSSVEMLRYRVRESLQRYVHFLVYNPATEGGVISEGALIATVIPAMAVVADEGDAGDPGLQLGGDVMFDPLLDDLAEAEVTLPLQQNSFNNTATAVLMGDDSNTSSALPPLPLCFEAEPAAEEDNLQYCVSLQFLLHFVHKHRIAPHTTTAEVIETIIKEQTSANGKSYVETHLVSSFPSYVVNAKDHLLPTASPRNTHSEQHAHITYVSHCHGAPFCQLIELLKHAAFKQYSSPFVTDRHAEQDDFQLDAYCGQEVFFWIDVFCHNQHGSSINTQHISDCISIIGHVTLALSPAAHPLVLERTWCLYEISTAHLSDCKLYVVDEHHAFYNGLHQAAQQMPGYHDSLSEEENFAMLGKAMQSLFPIQVQTSKASKPEDFDRLIHVIERREGVNKANTIVVDRVLRALLKQHRRHN